jgi:hypothetical protein
VTIAIRPLRRRGTVKSNHDFCKNESGIFLREGLDKPNQLEAAYEIRLFAHAIVRVKMPVGQSEKDEIRTAQLPAR